MKRGLGGWVQPHTLQSGSLPPLPPRCRVTAYVASAPLLALLAAVCGCAANQPTAHAPTGEAVDPSRGSETTSVTPLASSPDVKRGIAPPPSTASAADGLPAPSARAAPDRKSQPSRGTSLTSGVTIGDPELARLLTLGEGALQRGDYASAVDSFRRARRHAPDHALPVVGLVAARFGQLGIPTEYKGAVGNRDIKELLRLLDEVLRREPNSGAAHLERGRLLVVLGQGNAARSSLVKACVLLPENAEAHSVLAVVELSEGKVAEALAGFARASELDPNNAERLSNWGTALLMHGDVQQAISVLRSAVSLAPNDARARGDLGTALLAISDVSQALSHLERAHELAPRKATFMSNLGYAHQQLGDLTTAERWYTLAVTTDPQLGSAWINFGTLHAARGDYDAAEQAFRKALALDPEDPRVLGNLDDLAQLRAH